MSRLDPRRKMRCRQGAAALGVLIALLAGAAARAPAIQLEPVLSGLSSPLYLTSARDGSGRLFVVEQAGVVKVFLPGAPAPAVFLDIRDRVLSGDERGLLGLAFHPDYAVNGRFFVNYTRRPDGATVIAQYRRGPDPNAASSDETAILVVAQPFANHNGGMIAFGPDRLLYIGMGDGGSANDPGNRAQDVNSLLGKILRIDVDGGVPYASPADNPFAGGVPGRDEIFAFGLRNPFRFSFDRLSGQLLAGDVGQGAWEEVDVVTRGANLGWRVFEGNHCTGLGPAPCTSGDFTPPIAEYAHTGGRCSVTGGYVYRGNRGTLPAGTYVFADYCTGEIFTAPGGSPAVLIDTPFKIASFGEDEAGEIYVVDLGGAVVRLAAEGQVVLAGAVLPSSRSVTVGTAATAFATMLNAGSVTGVGCQVSLATPIAATFAYQTTDPDTNAVTGTANTPVDIAPGGRQTFVIAVMPQAPLPPTVIGIGFQCLNGPAAPTAISVNTLLLSAALGPTPDPVALIAFVPGGPAFVDLSGAGRAGAFAVAAVNVGASGRISVKSDTGGVALPVALAVCQTDAQGQCLGPAATSVAVDVPSGGTPTFAVFAAAAGTVPFDPATNRIVVHFFDSGGVERGQTSAAISAP